MRRRKGQDSPRSKALDLGCWCESGTALLNVLPVSPVAVTVVSQSPEPIPAFSYLTTVASGFRLGLEALFTCQNIPLSIPFRRPCAKCHQPEHSVLNKGCHSGPHVSVLRSASRSPRPPLLGPPPGAANHLNARSLGPLCPLSDLPCLALLKRPHSRK